MQVKHVAVFSMLVCYVNMVLTFIVAYIDPGKRVLVTINTYNEANLELMLILLSIPFVLKYLYKELAAIV